MQKIRMKKVKDITIREGYEEFLRRCMVKNYSRIQSGVITITSDAEKMSFMLKVDFAVA